jgi:hypothetical protein
MKVLLLNEQGYAEAVQGFALSYATQIERVKEILPKFAFGVPGESKFLESIVLWVDVTAPRFWWQEADTYRVGCSKNSESTMHTITKRYLLQEDFEYLLPVPVLDSLNLLITDFRRETDKLKKKALFLQIKNNLPEGFLQRRIWMLNYKTLQNIFIQRYNHKLPQWKLFLDVLLGQIQHPEFINPDFKLRE